MIKSAGQFCFTHTTGEDVHLFTLQNTKETEILMDFINIQLKLNAQLENQINDLKDFQVFQLNLNKDLVKILDVTK